VSGNVWPELITVGTAMRPMVSGIALLKREMGEREFSGTARGYQDVLSR
jgi:hypothetical protein